jgi:hypothetical protein
MYCTLCVILAALPLFPTPFPHPTPPPPLLSPDIKGSAPFPLGPDQEVLAGYISGGPATVFEQVPGGGRGKLEDSLLATHFIFPLVPLPPTVP